MSQARVLVEVTGGCAHCTPVGEVEVTLVDYDNGDTLPADWAAILAVEPAQSPDIK